MEEKQLSDTDSLVNQKTSKWHPQYIIALLFVIFIAIIICMIFWQKNTILEARIASDESASSTLLTEPSDHLEASANIQTAQQNMEDFTSKHDKISETDVEQYWEISSLKEQNAILEAKIQALKEYNEKLVYSVTQQF